MEIAVLGTGMVGQALAARLAHLGHRVRMGTRDPGVSIARTEPDAYGNPGLSAWTREHPTVGVVSFTEAVDGADLVINALSGAASVPVLSDLAALLEGVVVLDVANPLDPSTTPPTLSVKDTDSLAEQIQRALPKARVVKSLNTMNAFLMVDPGQLADGGFTTFVSGDDRAAKAQVTELLTQLGHRDILDLGDLSTARGTEMLLPLWLRLWGALGTPMFDFKVVR